MPTKKPAKKTPAKSVVETKAKAFAKTVEKEAKELTAEGKEFGTKIGNRWNVSSTEEKIYTIVGIALLIRGLYQLKDLVRGGILIVVGILFVTGFFTKGRKGK